MRITRRGLGITGALGAAALMLNQCTDDPYPNIAVAFNKHGHASAARDMDINQASKRAMSLCIDAPHRGSGHGCSIKFEFAGTSQFCVNAGMYINPQGQMTFTAMSYPKGENQDIALDACNENDDNVCRPGGFLRLCNH